MNGSSATPVSESKPTSLSGDTSLWPQPPQKAKQGTNPAEFMNLCKRKQYGASSSSRLYILSHGLTAKPLSLPFPSSFLPFLHSAKLLTLLPHLSNRTKCPLSNSVPNVLVIIFFCFFSSFPPPPKGCKEVERRECHRECFALLLFCYNSYRI